MIDKMNAAPEEAPAAQLAAAPEEDRARCRCARRAEEPEEVEARAACAIRCVVEMDLDGRTMIRASVLDFEDTRTSTRVRSIHWLDPYVVRQIAGLSTGAGWYAVAGYNYEFSERICGAGELVAWLTAMDARIEAGAR